MSKKKSSGAKASKSKSSSDTKPAASEKKSAKSGETSADKSDSAADKSTDSTDSSESGSEKPSESGAEKSSESGGGKSQKETMSSSDVHYGYFSSVRTPAYRKGWDDIFGKEKKSANGAKKKAGGKTRNSKRAKIKAPLSLELDINELPQDLRAALDDEIRRQTNRRRINFDKLNAAGAVHWSINCEIKR